MVNFIDESVEIRQRDISDYIGSARLPLKDLLTKETVEGTLPIKNEKHIQTGTVEVRVTLSDINPRANKDREADRGQDMM